jgi:predicted SAM-dependent methyltransferase
MYRSETDLVRHLTLPWILGPVVADIGFGGDKIIPHAIGIDLPQGYADTGLDTVDVACDVSKGIPVLDNTYNTVYSSHLIEDFIDTKSILKEFIRILRPGGRLVLVFPDQQRYEAVCTATGQVSNAHHKIPEMGLAYMLRVIKELNCGAAVLFSSDCAVSYNVVLVLTVPKEPAPSPAWSSRITLAIVDDVDPEGSARLLNRMAGLAPWGAVKLFTSQQIAVSAVVELIQTPKISSILMYAEYVVRKLKDSIHTDYVLVCQRDGYIANLSAWTDEFFSYDYIGAPWPSHIKRQAAAHGYVISNEPCLVGNGGFSLRSRAFLEAGSTLPRPVTDNEDQYLCTFNRDALVEKGIKIAPVSLASRFSVENLPYTGQFGFHGVYTTGIPGNPELTSRYGSNKSNRKQEHAASLALKRNSSRGKHNSGNTGRRSAPIPAPERVVPKIQAPKTRPAPPPVPPTAPTTIQNILAMRQRRAGRK